MSENPYKVLGVKEGASYDEIKRSYRELVKKYHPDKYRDNPLADLADVKMREINQAYDSLMKGAGSSFQYQYENGETQDYNSSSARPGASGAAGGSQSGANARGAQGANAQGASGQRAGGQRPNGPGANGQQAGGPGANGQRAGGQGANGQNGAYGQAGASQQGYAGNAAGQNAQGSWQGKAQGGWQGQQSSYGGEFELARQARNFINAGNMMEAQRILDRMRTRNGEWFYLQGLIFLRKGWYDRGYASIQRAVQMDPGNYEYRNALNGMNNQFQGYRQQYVNRGAAQNPDMCQICGTLWCADSCCECVGGDLIGCC